MTSQPGKQTIAMQCTYCPTPGNQAMKFGQLIEYNMRNIFLGKSYMKCGRLTIPRAIFKKSKLSLSLDQ